MALVFSLKKRFFGGLQPPPDGLLSLYDSVQFSCALGVSRLLGYIFFCCFFLYIYIKIELSTLSYVVSDFFQILSLIFRFRVIP
jgi:hypothetical protein